MEPGVTSSRRPWRARTTSCRRSWTWLSPVRLDLPSDFDSPASGSLTAARLASSAAIRSGTCVRLRRLGLDGDLLAVGLALDQLEHLLAVLVVVLRGLEVRRQRVDQLLGHLELAVGGLEVLGRGQLVEVVGGHDLVVEDHRLHHQHVAGAGRIATSCSLERSTTRAIATLPDSLHRLEQQPVGLRRALVGHEVVRVVVVDRVDVRRGRRSPRCRSCASSRGRARRAPRA